MCCSGCASGLSVCRTGLVLEFEQLKRSESRYPAGRPAVAMFHHAGRHSAVHPAHTSTWLPRLLSLGLICYCWARVLPYVLFAFNRVGANYSAAVRQAPNVCSATAPNLRRSTCRAASPLVEYEAPLDERDVEPYVDLRDAEVDAKILSTKLDELELEAGKRDHLNMQFLRVELIEAIFRKLDERSTGLLGSGPMRKFADTSGFVGDENVWNQEYQLLCEDLQCTPAAGVNLTAFKRLVNDPCSGGAYCDDEELSDIYEKLKEEKLAKAAIGKRTEVTRVRRLRNGAAKNGRARAQAVKVDFQRKLATTGLF